MTITRRHILAASSTIAVALVLQTAPVSGEGQLQGERPVEITFSKWVTGLTFVPVFGIQEGRALMAGVTGGAVPGTFVGEVLRRQASANPALLAGIIGLEAIYEVHDANGDHVLTTLIRGGTNAAAGSALLDGYVLAGLRTGAPVHVKFDTVVGCEGAPTPATVCFVGTIQVGRTPARD